MLSQWATNRPGGSGSQKREREDDSEDNEEEEREDPQNEPQEEEHGEDHQDHMDEDHQDQMDEDRPDEAEEEEEEEQSDWDISDAVPTPQTNLRNLSRLYNFPVHAPYAEVSPLIGALHHYDIRKILEEEKVEPGEEEAVGSKKGKKRAKKKKKKADKEEEEEKRRRMGDGKRYRLEPRLKALLAFIKTVIRTTIKSVALHRDLTRPPPEEGYHQICWSCNRLAPNQGPVTAATFPASAVLRCSRCHRVAHRLDPCLPELFEPIISAESATLIPSYEIEQAADHGHALCKLCQAREAEFIEGLLSERTDPTFFGRLGHGRFFHVFFLRFTEQYVVGQQEKEKEKEKETAAGAAAPAITDLRQSPLWSLQALYNRLDRDRLMKDRLDLRAIEAKARRAEYRLFEEMNADLQTISHNLLFLYGKLSDAEGEGGGGSGSGGGENSALSADLAHLRQLIIDLVDDLLQAFWKEQEGAAVCLCCYNAYADQEAAPDPDQPSPAAHWSVLPCNRLHKLVWYKLSPKKYINYCLQHALPQEKGPDGRGNVFRLAFIYHAPSLVEADGPLCWRTGNRRFVLKPLDPQIRRNDVHFSSNDFSFTHSDCHVERGSDGKSVRPILLRRYTPRCPEKADKRPAEVAQYQEDCVAMVRDELVHNWASYHVFRKEDVLLPAAEAASAEPLTLPSREGTALRGSLSVASTSSSSKLKDNSLFLRSFIRPREEWAEYREDNEAAIASMAYWPEFTREEIIDLIAASMKSGDQVPQMEFSSHEEFDKYIYKLYKLLDILQGPFWRCKHCKTYVASMRDDTFPYCRLRCAQRSAFNRTLKPPKDRSQGAAVQQ